MTIVPARIAILSNSGLGKSTFARSLAQDGAISTPDLNTIFREPDQIAVPRPIEDANCSMPVEKRGNQFQIEWSLCG